MNTTAAAGPAAAAAAFSTASFTPLESLLLFQSIIKFGIDPEAFERTSAVLQNNAFIQSDDRYDANRLKTEPLQALFLQLLRDELTAAEDDKNSRLSNGSQLPSSPTTAAAALSRKRKPLPTLHDARAHADQLPALVERLYARYRENVAAAIRQDEIRFAKIQREIRNLEQQQELAGEEEQKKAEQRQVPTLRATPIPHQATTAGEALALSIGQNGAEIRPPPSAITPQTDGKSTNAKPPDPVTKSALLSSSAATKYPQTSLSPQRIPAIGATGQQGVTAGNPLLPAASPAVPKQTGPGQVANLSTSQHPHTQATSTSATPLQSSTPTTQRLQSLLGQAPTAATSTGTLAAQIPSGASKLTPQAAASQPATLAPRPLSPAAPAPERPQQSRSASQQPLQAGVMANQAVSNAALSVSRTTSPNTPRAQTSTIVSPSPLQSTAQFPHHLALQPAVQTPQAVISAASRADAQRLAPLTSNVGSLQGVAQPPRVSNIPPQGASDPQAGAGGALSSTSVARDNAPPSLGNRPPLPEHVRVPVSSTPTPVQSPRPLLPHTPVQLTTGGFIPRGSGTRWKPSDPTPSTPGPDVGDMASPAYEPLSPVQTGAVTRADSVEGTDVSSVSPSTSATLLRQPRHLRKPQHSKPGKIDSTSSRPRGGRPSRHTRSHGEADEDNLRIKHEESTPKALDDVAEMTTEENMESTAASPGIRPLKRKRDESVDFPSPYGGRSEPDPSVLAKRRLVGPPTPPTHVLWMRGFPKISASALDQISSHRHANMFAHKIRDRDAPGYGSIVRHPVDLKSIRMAITQGNKAAMATAAALPEADHQSGASSVWLPISEDLVPPRGIINSSQLECELVHMFANAIMYNPDSHRGPGPAFMAAGDSGDDETSGSAGGADGGGYARYKVDEDGVVNDTRDMYVEVEKLLSEMRSAERQRGVPQPPPGAKGLGLPIDDAELLGVAREEGENEDNGGNDDRDAVAAEAHAAPATSSVSAADVDAEGSGTTKRRRITRGQ